jgi:hypothetical protein
MLVPLPAHNILSCMSESALVDPSDTSVFQIWCSAEKSGIPSALLASSTAVEFAVRVPLQLPRGLAPFQFRVSFLCGYPSVCDWAERWVVGSASCGSRGKITFWTGADIESRMISCATSDKHDVNSGIVWQFCASREDGVLDMLSCSVHAITTVRHVDR